MGWEENAPTLVPSTLAARADEDEQEIQGGGGMRKLVDIVLIAFSPDAHEVGEDPVSERNPVQAEEMSLNQYDITEAGGTGLKPEAKILIPMDEDYHGERELIYNGERWEVINTDPYKDWNGVILRIRRKKGNSGRLEVNRTA